MAKVIAPTKPTAKGKTPEAEVKKPKGPSTNLPALKSNVPSGVVIASEDDIAEFAGDRSGFENVKTSDLIIPRLKLLQKLSPQCDPDDEKYVDGAKPGMFYDFSTKELFEEELELIACHYVMEYIEWYPRETKKGIAFNHGSSNKIMLKTHKGDTDRDKWKNWLPNGNQIIETAEYFVLNMTVGGRRSFLPLQSTGLTSSRNWLTAMDNIKLTLPTGEKRDVPLHYQSWIAKPFLRDDGANRWYIWQFTAGTKITDLDPSKELLHNARNFHEQAVEGLVKGDVSENDSAEAEVNPNGKM